LVTRNDIKSIVIPETAFGIFSALSGPVLTTNPSPQVAAIFMRLPRVILWIWLNVLIFDLANQRLMSSVIEDSINKPWRPLPSGRMSVSQARRFLLAILPLVFVMTFYLGGLEETVAMMVLTWMYNDLGGADESYVVRNLINAFGFVCYSSGATLVSCGFGEYSLNPAACQWLAIIGGIVFSTLQMQDMADQEGDQARDRRTVPLVHGDGPARWTIIIPVMMWSMICPMFWKLHPYAYIVPLTLGASISLRLFFLRTVESDKRTWKLWNAWISSLYLLPLIKFHWG
jgi:4-hydroxybenzoate polyprenyltransferase